MTLRTGVDLIEIERVKEAIGRHGERFLGRVFTPAEITLCAGKVESLAGRYAAKEAVAKALGCGIGEVGWQDIEVLHDEHRAPRLNLSGEAKRLSDELGLQEWSLSLSHSQSHAVAFVVAVDFSVSPNLNQTPR
jgi:holo-[acyl-carrier protein] synthase